MPQLDRNSLSAGQAKSAESLESGPLEVVLRLQMSAWSCFHAASDSTLTEDSFCCQALYPLKQLKTGAFPIFYLLKQVKTVVMFNS